MGRARHRSARSDGARHLHARRHVELAEQVAHVALDRLQAEEQLGGDLGVGPAVHDQPRHLELALGQRSRAPLPSALPGRVRRWMWWPSLRSSRSAASR